MTRRHSSRQRWTVPSVVVLSTLLAALPAAGQAVLTNANAIIRNSLCLGGDCVGGVSFSDATLLLTENNTRIKFDDTSVANAFPRNDWELEANSSTNGGANRFSLLDCGESSQGGCASDVVFGVEAGARQFGIYLESDGDVGFGTSNPVVTLHAVDGNTPTLRLQQDGSAGFTPQIWDLAGNETNFFVRDATNGSQLPLRIRPNAPSNSIFVDAGDGDVGLGTSAPEAPLHVSIAGDSGSTTIALFEADDRPRVVLERRDAPARLWSFGVGGAGIQNGYIIDEMVSAGTELSLTPDGDLTIEGSISTADCMPCVSDYVFEPGYELMPLAELERFIAANGHLPNVPSQADVDRAGKLDMTLMQMRMLEKIEELTLYTLEQQRTIETLTVRLAALEGG